MGALNGTKLVLIEGIPGAGKSSTCQLLRRSLHAASRPSVWWHEEQKGHPIYLFDDGPSLRATLADLEAGRYAVVIEAAIERWRVFASVAATCDEVVLVDSCLYGYLTWTLFSFDVPMAEIERYVATVEGLVRSLEPRLVYLRQDDVAATLSRATETRSNGHLDLYIERAERSPYGARRGLRGFVGLVAYWDAYCAVADELFERSTLARVRLPSTNGWPARQRALLAFLGLPPAGTPSVDPQRFTGWYEGTEVRLEGDELYAYDLPDRWHRLRLVPLGGAAFEVESLPHRVEFLTNEADRVVALRVRGPEMLVSPALDRRLARSEE